MPDQAAAGLEESLLEARQRPALDGPGEASRRRRFPRLYAMTPKSSRTSLARKRWQESRVQCLASLPSLIPVYWVSGNGAVRRLTRRRLAPQFG
jgi:hypothetical protein